MNFIIVNHMIFVYCLISPYRRQVSIKQVLCMRNTFLYFKDFTILTVVDKETFLKFGFSIFPAVKEVISK